MNCLINQQISKSNILQAFHLSDTDIISIFPYGSRVYGTNSEKSDYDFIIISNKSVKEFALSSNDNKINVHLYSVSDFQEQLNNHKISAMECFFLPKDKLLKSSNLFKFKLNKNLLRSVISEKASHSWVKAKKKLEVEKDKDVYIAKKSLFHSLRIIDFGTQIAKDGKIIDYSSSNNIWDEIKDDGIDDWDFYKEKYQDIFNSRMTEFRKLAPKL